MMIGTTHQLPSFQENLKLLPLVKKGKASRLPRPSHLSHFKRKKLAYIIGAEAAPQRQLPSSTTIYANYKPSLRSGSYPAATTPVLYQEEGKADTSAAVATQQRQLPFSVLWRRAMPLKGAVAAP